MKKNLFLLLLFFVAISCWVQSLYAQSVQAHMDERVELMALVARLAGSNEFSAYIDSVYATSADTYFEPYQNHEAVKLYKQARRKEGIAYDAVVAYAMHLQITDNPQQPIVWDTQLKKNSDSSFDRWSPKMSQKFLLALNTFYRDSHFHDWYMATDSLRSTYQQAQQAYYDKIDYAWYDDFFAPNAKLQRGIVISLLLGYNNYGLSWELVDGTFVTHPVFGIWEWNDLMIVIHEFCHPYCNPLVDKYWSEMSEVAQKAYKSSAKVLLKRAYSSPQVMMYETFVRAATLMYVKEKLPTYFSMELLERESNAGFTLIKPIFESMMHYRENAETYPTFEDYIPILLKDLQR